MPENQGCSVSEHDWHSPSYVDWWIARDRDRDAVRRQRLRAMLAHANVMPDAEISVLDVGGGYGVVTEEVLTPLPYRTIFPQMTLWLPEDERAQLRFEFETELERLEAA